MASLVEKHQEAAKDKAADALAELAIAVMQFVFWVVFAPVRMITNGYILCLFWKWFVIRALPVAPLSLVVAIGLFCVVGIFRTPVIAPKEPAKFIPQLVSVVMQPLLVLFFGWAVHLFL